MFFGARLVSADGNIPTTIGEVIGKDQAMDLDCETSSGIAFQLGVSFHFEAAEDQDAPTSLKGIAPTSEDNNDGRITGVDDTMEYRLQGEDKWTKVEKDATEITGLAAGTYEVRCAAKGGYNAGAAVEVEVPEYEAPKYVITFSVDGDNGTLTAAVEGEGIESGAEIKQGKEIVFTAEAAEGYRVKQWVIDENVVADNATNTLTIESLTAAIEVTVEFEKIPPTIYTLTLSGEGLTAEPEAENIEEGKSNNNSNTTRR